MAEAGAAHFTGYASLFNLPDLGRDIIAPGAFAKCLRRAPPQRIAMLYQHDATRPIGVWQRLRETAHGLWAEGVLALGSDGGRNAYALLEAGALDGLSIGYRTVRAEPLAQARRRLLEVELVEISLVTFPMQPEARVARLRATPRTAEARLRATPIKTEARLRAAPRAAEARLRAAPRETGARVRAARAWAAPIFSLPPHSYPQPKRRLSLWK